MKGLIEMREQEYIEAIEQIRVDETAQQRIIAACAKNARKPTPRRRTILGIAGAALVLLLLIGGALLPRLSPAPRGFTITAYALDGDTGPVVLGGEATEFSFQSGAISGRMDSGAENLSSGYAIGFLSLGGGEHREPIRFHCEGEGIESITYTAEGCSFTEKVVLHGWENYFDENGHTKTNLHLEKVFISMSWAFDDDGQPWSQGTAICDLGHSYTVAYEEQNESSYQIRYPLKGVRKEDYDGVSPILMEKEVPLPSGVLHPASHVPTSVTYYYFAEEASITVTANFANGTTQSKELLLTLTPTSSNWFTLSITVVE